MTIAQYQTLTGTTVSDADTARMKAIIRRAETKLEALLGYSLSDQKTWTELGKVQQNGYIPFPSLPVNEEILTTLSAPDPENGDIQLFNYDSLNTHFRINPATQVYSAKLVLPVDDSEFITIYTLENITPYLNSAGYVTALSRNYDWFTWDWYSSLPWDDRNNLMLAVEADYLGDLDIVQNPDLGYLLADMVTYYSDPNYSIMGNIRSESIDSHSYSRASTGNSPDSAAPEGQISSQRIIEKYAGPAAFRKRIV